MLDRLGRGANVVVLSKSRVAAGGHLDFIADLKARMEELRSAPRIVIESHAQTEFIQVSANDGVRACIFAELEIGKGVWFECWFADVAIVS